MTGINQLTTKGPEQPPLVSINTICDKDTAYWTAWLAYTAHDAMVVTKYGSKLVIHTIDPESGQTLSVSHYWDLAAWQYMHAHQKVANTPTDVRRILIAAGNMASVPYDQNGPQHIIESRHRFPQVWAGIPVHDETTFLTLVQRLQAPFTAYEEAIAVTKGIPEVYRHQLQQNDVGWPAGREWATLLNWPQTCPTCGAAAGHHCTSTRSNRAVERHQKRRLPL